MVVVDAHRTESAWARALAWFLLDQDTVNACVIAELSHPGTPPPGAVYLWNDLRAEPAPVPIAAPRAGDPTFEAHEELVTALGRVVDVEAGLAEILGKRAPDGAPGAMS